MRLKQEVVACKEELKEGISEFEFFFGDSCDFYKQIRNDGLG